MSYKQKILIVDDKIQNLIALENVLKECDAEVIKALSGNEALKASLDNDFALAILDVNMPEMNGYELAEFLVGEEKTKHLPVIFLSAEYSDDMHIMKAYESGGIDFVSKPFNPYYLLSKVNIFLKLDRQRHELLEKIDIEKSKNYLESILMSVNDFIVVTSLDNKIDIMNNSVLKKLEYSFDELFAEKTNKLFPVKTADRIEEIIKQYAGNTIEKNLPYYREETYLKKKLNGEIPVILSLSPLITKSGIVSGAVFVATDITERKMLEEKLRTAKDKAEEVSRIKSSFLSNMSHELRTPMVGILGFSEMLANLLQNDEHKEYAEMIHKGGTRLMETLNLILDISLIESDNVEIKVSSFGIVSLTLEIVKLFEKFAAKKGLYINIGETAEDFIIKQDAGMIRQVLNNLINNALKFTNKGGITISFDKEINNSNEFIIIRVKDTGIGIPSDKISIIWDEFRQVSEGHGRSFEGTGLGLSLTKKFMDKLGGEVCVEESKVGEGTTFKVTLPAALKGIQINTQNIYQDDVNVESGNEQKPVSKTEIPSILYVEDDPASALLVKTSISNYCSIDIVPTGEEAVEYAKKKKYSAVLMDINLGNGMNGIKTTELIKSINSYKNIPFVALTAFAMVGDKEEFESMGFNYYLSKPFTKKDLTKLIEKLESEIV